MSNTPQEKTSATLPPPEQISLEATLSPTEQTSTNSNKNDEKKN
ncbi:6066_t:CDS:1, partial [Scutellospora calospora]